MMIFVCYINMLLSNKTMRSLVSATIISCVSCAGELASLGRLPRRHHSSCCSLCLLLGARERKGWRRGPGGGPPANAPPPQQQQQQPLLLPATAALRARLAARSAPARSGPVAKMRAAAAAGTGPAAHSVHLDQALDHDHEPARPDPSPAAPAPSRGCPAPVHGGQAEVTIPVIMPCCVTVAHRD